MIGYVVRFDPNKMFGFIRSKEGDSYMFTIREVEASGHDHVNANLSVQFEAETDRYGRRIAKNIKF